MTRKKNKFRPLSQRLLLLILSFSIFATAIAAFVSAKLDFDNEMERLEGVVQQIELTSLSGIATAMWNFEEQVLLKTVMGFTKLKDVHRIVVKDVEGSVLVDTLEIKDESTPTNKSKDTVQSGWLKDLIGLPEFKKSTTKIEFDNDGEIEQIGSMEVTLSTKFSIARIESKVETLIGAETAKTAVFAFFFLFIIAVMVTRPLERFKSHLENNEETEDSSVETLVFSQKSRGFVDDEIDLLVDSYNDLTKENFNHLEEIERSNEQLEQRVRERTEELDLKNKEIESVFNSMNQGIFSLDSDLNFTGQHSLFLEEILEEKNLDKKNIEQMLFRTSSLGSEEISMATSALNSFFGCDSLVWDLNSHSLPQEFEWKSPSGQTKVMEVQWSPIISREDTIEQVVVTLRDVTELRLLQREADEKSEELQVLVELLNVDKDSYKQFSDLTVIEFKKIQDFMATSFSCLDVKRKEIFRSAHTIKGTARSVGLKALSSSVHIWEQAIENYEGVDDIASSKEILSLQEEANNLYKKYDQVAKDTLNFFELDDRQLVESTEIKRIITSYRKDPEKALEKIESLLSSSSDAPSPTFQSFFGGFKKMISSTAKEVGRENPGLNIHISEGLSEISWKSETARTLYPVFMHLLSNCVDHGLESADMRIALGKKPAGEVFIEAREVADSIRICVWDDGSGFDIEGISKQAAKKGLIDTNREYSVVEIAELVFEAGLSTTQEVSQVSGRGAGMDIVKATIEDLGGSLKLIEDDEYGHTVLPGRAKLRFEILLPSFVFQEYRVESVA